jgi:hypothetical protein
MEFLCTHDRWNFLRQGVAQMTDYRVYIVGRDGHFVSAIQLDCPNDNAAIESAKQFVNGHGIELWQRDRIVVKLDRKPDGE